MTEYRAPLADMRFVINQLADLDGIAGLPGCAEITPDLVDAILEEAGKLAAEVLAPLNHPGDVQGCVLENGVVRAPDGFKEAYARFVEGGWNGVPFDSDYGGQNLPWLVATAVSEIWCGANMAFSLCPMLTQAAVEALSLYGSDGLKAAYLAKLVSGEWSGTMDLTEPQAGSDLSQVRTKAVRHGEAVRITGQKVFITYGEHDLAANIVHMVLARSPDGPPGIKGLSLYLVPKFLPGEDGGPGPRNDLRAVSLEHKLGINASPTLVMSFGDDGGATGFLIGEENRGIEYMFTMMNNARLAVGLQGVGIGERAYQQARAYAGERVQGRDDDGRPVTIDHHPDVKRMLLAMKADTEAGRGLAYFVAGALDKAKRHPDAQVRADNQALVDLLVPVVKAWITDIGIETANTGVQVHGGMGYIEETGAAQYLRDARIAAIYEGTNGIQAADLVGRKVARDGGAAARMLIARMAGLEKELAAGGEATAAIGVRLADGVRALASATDWLVHTHPADPMAVDAGAVLYLRLMGTVAAGWLMARAALIAARAAADYEGGDGDGGGDPAFLAAKALTARFFADQRLVQAPGLASAFMDGAAAVRAVHAEHL